MITPRRQKCLMLGCSHHTPKRVLLTPLSLPEGQTDWTTLDINPSVKPDVIFDLNRIEKGEHLPFPDSHFDVVHAYSLMEHYGRQGDYVGFFVGFRELWRILKPYGFVVALTPQADNFWAWSDPGHTRVISGGTVSYLTKGWYENLGNGSPATDYRHLVHPYWWRLVHTANDDQGGYTFGLQKEPQE